MQGSKPRRRVFLYITRPNQLLVLRHVDFPDLRLEIPGGTVEKGEQPSIAASREAWEETGLSDLGEPKLLGSELLTVPSSSGSVLLDSWFYQIVANGEVPDLWRHVERFPSGHAKTILFELSWIGLAEARTKLGAADLRMIDAIDPAR